jgi:hypothetical protein
MAPALSPVLEEEDTSEGQRKMYIQRPWAYIVTLEGSPPNAVIYFWTHLNARRSKR